MILKLTLTNFRNYHAAALEIRAKTIVLVGPNGAGKTNLIEAISFFTPGRGLRRAVLGEVAFSEGDGSWAVAAEIEGALGLATLGTGIERPLEDGATTLRKYRIDREGRYGVIKVGNESAEIAGVGSTIVFRALSIDRAGPIVSNSVVCHILAQQAMDFVTRK